MKKNILFVLITVGCLAMITIFPVQFVLAAVKEAKLMPMDLDETRWDIEVVSISKKGAKKIKQDILIFEDKKFVSDVYKKKGYDPTNYSLSVSGDDITSFGTMQIKNKETVFWKGKVSGEKIDGSIHVQRSSGDNVTHYYTGKLSKGILTRKGEPKPVDPVSPEVKQ